LRWSMPEALPVFDARLRSLDSADDFVLVLDKKHGDFAERRVNLLGVECPQPEPGTSEAGMKAKDFALKWFAEGALVGGHLPFTVQTVCPDESGRWLSRVWRKSDGAELTAALIHGGHGEPVSDMGQIRDAREGGNG
jgi:hypothetical protein